MSKVCPPCDNELKADNIMEHYCASDFGKYQQLKRVRPAYGHIYSAVQERRGSLMQSRPVCLCGALSRKNTTKFVTSLFHKLMIK